MPTATHHILRFREVCIYYGTTCALRDLTLDIPCGSATAIMGRNGAGKSTLLRAILGWQSLTQGEIRIGDAHPQHALPRLAYVPQRHAIDWDFPITVRGVVEQGRYAALRPWQRLRRHDHQQIDDAMAELDIADLGDRQIRMLSGGQQQRVFLARAIAQGGDIFLLDEPFTGLDLLATEELAHTLATWSARGRTVLAAVHDLETARRTFSHGVLLDTSLIATGPIDAVLTPDNIDQAFRDGRSAGDPLRLVRSARFPS